MFADEVKPVGIWPVKDDQRRQWCASQGIHIEHHCCLDLAFAISEPLLTPHQGPNRIIDWIASWNEYWIPVPYDGYSSTIIHHCPWCGQKLPESLRGEWYRVLNDLGYSDPSEDGNIPTEFESDHWWRKRGEPNDARESPS